MAAHKKVSQKKQKKKRGGTACASRQTKDSDSGRLSIECYAIVRAAAASSFTDVCTIEDFQLLRQASLSKGIHGYNIFGPSRERHSQRHKGKEIQGASVTEAATKRRLERTKCLRFKKIFFSLVNEKPLSASPWSPLAAGCCLTWAVFFCCYFCLAAVCWHDVLASDAGAVYI